MLASKRKVELLDINVERRGGGGCEIQIESQDRFTEQEETGSRVRSYAPFGSEV